MRRLAPALALALVAVAAGDAAAHQVPARRTVVVQADGDGVAALVTWTSARGPQGAQMLARAAWGRGNDRALAALRSLAGSEALRGIEITVDGRAIKPEVKVKVRVDRQKPARLVAVVLITAPVTSGVVRVAVRGGASTRMTWRDRTDGRARSALAPGRWLAGQRTLRLVVREPDPVAR